MRYRKLLLVVSLGVCAVSGSSAFGARVFQESDGLIIVEAESAPAASAWAAKTARTGFTGTCYYECTRSGFKKPVGELIYRINITTAGTYNLCIRANKPDVGDTGNANDCYTKMVGHPGYQGSYVRTFLGGDAEKWSWSTTHVKPDRSMLKATYTLSAGEHEFRIAGRWKGFMIDRIHFYLSGVKNPLDTSKPESRDGPLETAEEIAIRAKAFGGIADAAARLKEAEVLLARLEAVPRKNVKKLYAGWFSASLELAEAKDDAVAKHAALTKLSEDKRIARCASADKRKLVKLLKKLRRTSPAKEEWAAHKLILRAKYMEDQAGKSKLRKKQAAQYYAAIARKYADTIAGRKAARATQRLAAELSAKP